MTRREKVRAFISENFLFGGGELEDTTPLLENRIIDSTGILELVAFIEEAFQVKVEDDDIIPENFRSVKSISEFLELKSPG